MSELVMPRLSDTMEDGTILRWLIADGEPVRRGQELVEIETDKATMIYQSDLEGVLHTVAAEGDTLPVGAVIAHLSGEAAAQAGGQSASREAPAAHGAASAAQEAPALEPGAGAALHAGAADGPLAGGETPAASANDRVKASPLARRLARERHVDLRTLTGSGPGGRIVKADVQAAAGAPSAKPAAPPAGATPARELAGVAGAKGQTSEIELSRTQQTIARRMAESKATIPHFTLQVEVDMQECAGLRDELKRLAAANAAAEATPTYNDMVVKACALALREHPVANSSYRDGRVQLHSRVNVGVAVAVESEGRGGGALIVPTVFDADLKSLGEIARETRVLAARVREHQITPPELGGATFTVSNLGMFGIESFTAIINPPQVAILSVGALKPRPVERDGELLARQTMTAILACDHRVLYGADAARFLTRIRELLERPAALAL